MIGKTRVYRRLTKMGELSPLRKQQTEQKQRSKPQNSLQENLVPRFSILPVSTERRVGENPGNEVGFRKNKKDTRSYWKGCKVRVSAVIVMNIILTSLSCRAVLRSCSKSFALLCIILSSSSFCNKLCSRSY